MSFEWLLPRAFDLSAAVAMVTVSRAVWKMTTTTTTTTTSGVRMSFPRRTTTTPVPNSPIQPSVLGDDAEGLLECRGGYPRPPVKYSRRRSPPPPSRRTPYTPSRLHGRVVGIYHVDVSLYPSPRLGLLLVTYNFQLSFVTILCRRVMKYDNIIWKNWTATHDNFWRHNRIDRFKITAQ